MATTPRYAAWASVYEEFEAETAWSTWRQGILADLAELRPSASRILDLGAGTGIGRRAMLEQEPTRTIVCLDRSPEMLALGVPADARVVADMSDFAVAKEAFDAVVCGFDALNCLPRDALAGALGCVADALQPGGHFVFDYSSRKLLARNWNDLDIVSESGGLRLHRTIRYEPVLERTRVELVLMTDEGPQWHELHYHYVVDPFTMEELATSRGLEILRIRDIGCSTFSPGAETHVYLMRKPGSP